jgi:hypothetical protein
MRYIIALLLVVSCGSVETTIETRKETIVEKPCKLTLTSCFKATTFQGYMKDCKEATVYYRNNKVFRVDYKVDSQCLDID